MKRAPRAVITALITASATAAAALSFSVAALATPVPPSPNAALFGTWKNMNPATKNVVDIVIAGNKRGVTVDGFGACHPTNCEWGNIPGTVFGVNVSSKTGTSFEANWNFGFSRTVLLGTLTKTRRGPALTVQEFTIFTDGSGRANYTVTEKFVRAKPVKPTKTGTPAADYPMGDAVSPVSALLGTWHNISATTRGIKKIILGKSSATLVVSAFGACGSGLCPFGTIRGITFGTSISSVSGRTFLAPYTFGFAKKLLVGTVRKNKAGRFMLTVRTYTEFTDNSGRSNYVITDTFRH